MDSHVYSPGGLTYDHKMGDTALTREDEEDDIGAAFQKFAVVTKELSALMKNMVSFLIFNKYSLYPLKISFTELY